MMNPKQGFTLVETLVAIAVLVIAVVGPMYAVHKSIMASYTARDTLVATSLAQEAVEYVRYVRDSNYLPPQDPNWLDDLTPCIVTGPEGPSDYGCGIDVYNQSISACPSNNCSPLVLDSSGFRYRQNGTGTATRFTRKTTIVAVNANEVEVTVTVSWSTFRIPYTVTVKEHLYNWL
jgi:prepilin-type N-terminal cleavage/methylation domain-containing protein